MGADVTREHNFHRNLSPTFFIYGSSIAKEEGKVKTKKKELRPFFYLSRGSEARIRKRLSPFEKNDGARKTDFSLLFCCNKRKMQIFICKKPHFC
jgi:hypothetical protein